MSYSNYRYLFAALLMTLLFALLILSPFYQQICSISVMIFSAVCHQRPERSIYLGGVPMVVCARCFGIYAGAWMGIMMAPWVSGKIRQRTLFYFFIPMLTDALINTAFTTPAPLRLATGLLAGFAVAVIALPAFVEALPWHRLRISERVS